MLRKIAVLTALTALAACGGGGGSDEESTAKEDAHVDAASGRDAEQADAEEPEPSDGGATDTGTAPMDAGRSDGGSAEAGPDAGMDAGTGSDATTDATLVDTAVIDSGSDAGAGDADVPDAAPDASLPMFTLSVRRGTATPLAQAPVFFHGADGALLSEQTTGSDGRVVSSTAPAMVTVIAPKTGNVTTPIASPQLFTFTQLSAGDDVVLQLPADEPASPPAPLPGYAVTVANTNPLPASTSLVVAYGGELSCADKLSEPYAPPIALAWPQGCAVQAANTLLAVAYNQISSTNVQPTGYAFAKGVAAFGNAPLAVTLGAWTAPVTTQVTFQNAPVGQPAEGKLLLYSEGASFDPTGKLALPFPGTAATRMLAIPTPSGLAAEQSALVNVGGPLAGQISSLATRGAPAATQTLDMATGLPGATTISINRSNAARAVVTWAVAATPANEADGSAVFLEYPGTTKTPWMVIAPATATTLTLPELPEARRAFLSAGAPLMYVSRFGSSTQQGYRDFLKEPTRPVFDGYHALQRTLTPNTSLQAISYSAP